MDILEKVTGSNPVNFTIQVKPCTGFDLKRKKFVLLIIVSFSVKKTSLSEHSLSVMIKIFG